MTPEEARVLLDGTVPGPWLCDKDEDEFVIGTEDFGIITEVDSESDGRLIAAAPALAELVANLRYEYLVAVGPEHSSVYATMNSQGRFVGATLLLADRWATKGEAQSLVDELREGNENSTARVVRRLVSEPEVAE